MYVTYVFAHNISVFLVVCFFILTFANNLFGATEPIPTLPSMHICPMKNINKIRVVLAIGSNANRRPNIENAKLALQSLFEDIQFSRIMRTRAIGIKAADFHNCMAIGHTDLDYGQLKEACNTIESACNDQAEKRRNGIIEMDIDILEYNGTKHHANDWNRRYIKILYNEINQQP